MMNIRMKTEGIYHEFPPQQDKLGNGRNGRTRSLVTGRNLAHAKRSAPERAFVGADLHLNRTELISPTVKQCACLVGVCAPYVTAAVKIVTADGGATRAAVLADDCALLGAAAAVAPESLAHHFARSTPDEWLKCAREVGPAAVWDHMIAPLV
jgi:hypothetical protein